MSTTLVERITEGFEQEEDNELKTERRMKLELLRKTRRPYDGLIVVGCGGNYWYAERYLMARLCHTVKQAFFIDPDTIERKNWGRQWVGHCEGHYKAHLAGMEWASVIPQPPEDQAYDTVVSHPNQVRDMRLPHFPGPPCNGLLIVCLPDNDQARLDTCVLAEDLLNEDRAHHIAVLVAGTDINRGQAYYGIATRRDSWLHDFREVHQGEIEEDGGRTEGCGQIAMSNQMTAIAIGHALDEILDVTDSTVSEWYWRYNPQTRQTTIHRREV